VSDIAAAAMLESLDAAESRWMAEVVTKLDRVYLEETYERLKRERKAAQSKAQRTNMGAPKRGR
jgi:hypothetical protein